MQDIAAFKAWQDQARDRLRSALALPRERIALEPESRGRIEDGGLVIEKWILTSEPGSRVPGVLFRPAQPAEARLPAVVMTFGHGGSKGQPEYSYTAQVFARLGFACLMLDPIGEEERHIRGAMGTRAHDPECVHRRAVAAGRLIMGKLVWDTMRGLDFLLERADIDPARIGVSGNSLGGAKAGWMAVLDTRLRFALISGWAFSPMYEEYGKSCTREPNRRRRGIVTWPEYLSLAAPHCALRIMNGDADTVIDKDGDGRAWRDTEETAAGARAVYAGLGRPDGIETWYERGGGHRPYPVRRPNLEWLVREARPAGWTPAQVRALPEINFGDWCRARQVELERLYGTPLHLQGATVADPGVDLIPRERLAVLRPDEVGQPDYTLEGWLDRIEADARARPARKGEPA